MKMREHFRSGIVIVNDNGSENGGKADKWLANDGVRITQYWCYLRRPKDKPFVEHFIGTLQTECLDCHFESMELAEMQEIIDERILKYENVCPHERA